MDREAQPLVDVRFLLVRVAAGSPARPAEIGAVRERLAAMRAHPSCAPERAEQLSAALLVLDVLALAEEGAALEALAG